MQGIAESQRSMANTHAELKFTIERSRGIIADSRGLMVKIDRVLANGAGMIWRD
jgi:hypothetical protein